MDEQDEIKHQIAAERCRSEGRTHRDWRAATREKLAVGLEQLAASQLVNREQAVEEVLKALRLRAHAD
jgi:hypothetical protein